MEDPKERQDTKERQDKDPKERQDKDPKERQEEDKQLEIPDEFSKIIVDFIADILTTFPEYAGIVARWWSIPFTEQQVAHVFQHCLQVFPERFFDILYKNTEIFSSESSVNTEFLPGIVFKHLWNFDISDNTKETIWKYLQLILFAIIGSVHHLDGDTSKMFEAIDEDELKRKLEETMEGMQGLFDGSGNMPTEMPDVEEIHEHINSLMGGKIGKLAMELAEEAAADLDIDLTKEEEAKNIFQQLFRNPSKMINMVKKLGTKMEEKIKSGEVKESELVEEGIDLLHKMKDMPGVGQMFSKMGFGKANQMNMGAMEAQMRRNLKSAKLKERYRDKVNARSAANETKDVPKERTPLYTDEELCAMFGQGKNNTFYSGEKPKKTMISQAKQTQEQDQAKPSKKKKKEKKTC
jgi:hypothetical protein